jgi:hypothetical protein
MLRLVYCTFCTGATVRDDAGLALVVVLSVPDIAFEALGRGTFEAAYDQGGLGTRAA